MPLHTPGLPPWVVNWARPGRLLAADGVTLKNINHDIRSPQAAAADGDRMQLFFICVGNETRMSIGFWADTWSGIFDLYVNGVLDSAGYENYAAAGVIVYRDILLTQPVRSGNNLVELRVNGKNAASTGYYLWIYGASLQ